MTHTEYSNLTKLDVGGVEFVALGTVTAIGASIVSILTNHSFMLSALYTTVGLGLTATLLGAMLLIGEILLEDV